MERLVEDDAPVAILRRPVPKRTFSPVGSDAGEPSLVEPTPVTHSPHQDRPLIRQAVAFASDKQPQNIVTYEATPPPNVTVRFLPGQEVPIPPKKKAKRTKKGDIFSAQTSKFRIDTYDPTPSTQPPIAHGNGPYSSMYRGTPIPPKPPRKVSPATTATSSTYTRNSSTATSNPPSSYIPPHPVSSVPTRPQQPPPQQPAATRSPSPPKKRAEPPSRFPEMEERPLRQNNYYSGYPPPPTSNSSAITPSPYYRHDYERGTWGHDHSRSPRQKSRNRRSMDRSQDSDSSARYHNRDSGRASVQSSDSAQQSKGPLRMLTLLIQDVRSGTTDHQLAEVKVPLRLADEAGTAFWADAQDIAEQLQRGPSRIDGPAKVYTPRGKYRHFILRVSKNNDDEFMSANVAVSPDRTVDLVVELLSPPGVPPAPPKIPSGLLDTSYDDDYERELSSDQMEVEVVVKKKPEQLQGSRKRANSPSFDDYDGQDSPPPPPQKVIRHKYPSESVRNHSQRHPSPESTISSGPPPRGRESISKESRFHDPIPATPPIPSSPRPLEADFMRALKEKVRDYDGKGFADFFRSNAGNTLSDTLSQYVFLKNILDKFVGQKVEQYAHPIEEKHIVKMMKIHDPTFVQDCKETMHLMPLYGDPTASRYDPKITEMLNHKNSSKEHARKEFLHLLYRNDNIWNNRPPDGPRPSANKSQTSSSDSSLSSRGDPTPGTRATKAMFVE
ncbi:hypothetical protein CVT25_003028 [Psilocybe cyanescens]|uniref:Uncharacterized protein n=1 Tax=Psilocybe cyanescens TaxID=93625 RepID=A0A409WN78_PSICY|nr:hypothetical protein CVT25_003028 [Psilocybe cyanescens]